MNANKKLRRDADGIPYFICPKCYTEIHGLIEIEITYKTKGVFPDEQSGLPSTKKGAERIWSETTKYKYRCPECFSILAESQEEAEALFQEPSS